MTAHTAGVRTFRWGLLTRSAVVGSYLAGALLITGRFWTDQDHIAPESLGDRAFAEWNIAHAARVVSNLENPLYSNQMNVPEGINTMANTSMLGLGIPVSPITLLFGAGAAFNVLIVLGIAGTALAWYFVLRRLVTENRVAAWIGGLVAGFTPSVVAHANLHPNLVAQFVVPLIVWRVVQLREAGRILRNGLLLAAFIVYQAFINEEVLFTVALGCGLFVLVYAMNRPAEARARAKPFLAGLGVAAVASGVLLAFPLYWQFAGPGSYHGIDASIAGLQMDLLRYVSFPSNSFAHQMTTVGSTYMHPEDNANLGWPLVTVCIMISIWLWHVTVVRAAAVTAVVLALLSLGASPTFDGDPIGVPGPWRLVEDLPLFDAALPIRVAMGVSPLVALIMAIGSDRLAGLTPPAGMTVGRRRLVFAGLAVALFLPIAPVPLPVVSRPAVPGFIAQGTWREFVRGGDSILFVPLPSFSHPQAILWSASTGLDLPMSHGYFLGPGVDRRGRFGPVPRPSDVLLTQFAGTGMVPVFSEDQRAQAREDFAYWRTAIVVVSAAHTVPAVYRMTVEQLVGQPGVLIKDVWVWDVRGLRQNADRP